MSKDRRLLSDVEIGQLCGLLVRLHEHRAASGGSVPPLIFNMAYKHGLGPGVAEEIVALDPEKRTVLLMERSSQDIDPYFYGKMALPGSMLRQGETESAPIQRALREFGEATAEELVFVDKMLFKTARGDELALVHRLFVDPRRCLFKGPRDGFYPVDALPKDTIDFHVDMIRMVTSRLGWK